MSSSLLEGLSDLARRRWFRWWVMLWQIPSAIVLPMSLLLTHWNVALTAAGSIATALFLFALSADVDQRRKAEERITYRINFDVDAAMKRAERRRMQDGDQE
ncbi:hypothetical protein SEA_ONEDIRECTION_48 [Gordonia phage OneDirection]|nr:hypothetical protein SEA_ONEDIRECTION_48 [Gordonia phage OneDirection]